MVRSFKVLAVHKQMFPGTYNFRDEAVGTSGTDINDVILNQCDTCEIVSDYLGHKKALHFVDSNSGQIRLAPHTETSGTFELWGNNPTANDWYIRHRDNDLNFPISIYVASKTLIQILHGNGAGGTTTVNVAIAEDEWFHIKVKFDCGTAKQSVWVNEVLEVDEENFDDDDTPTNLIYINTFNDGACEGYIDAIGYSWDANYKIGDNVYPKHLKESTDSFEGDDVGTQGTSITWVDSVDTAASFEIVAEFNEHKKVLGCKYTSGAGGEDTATHNYASQSTAGWIEGWVKAIDAASIHRIQLYEDAAIVFFIAIFDDKFQYYDGTWHDVGIAAIDNTWYHIFIQWYADNTADIWVNNVLYIAGVAALNNMVSGINKIYLREYDAANFCYYNAFTSSLDGDSRGDNRLFDYNSSYTSKDITTEVVNVQTTNKYGEWLKGTLITRETYENSEIFVQIYDVNDKLSMEAELGTRDQIGIERRYALRDKNEDDLKNESSNTFSAAKIHDPADSTSMLKVILPNVSEADGDLILVEGDTKTDTYSPTTQNYPNYKMLVDIGDLADSVVIIHPDGKCYLDDDKTSGTTLDFDTEADKDKMTEPPLVSDILEEVNYIVVKGDFNPETGTRFVKVIDNVGDDKKKSWRYTNNMFKSQTDVDAYAAKLVSRAITVKKIKFSAQSVGSHNMGETVNYKFVDALYNVPQANYYVIFEQIDYDKNLNVIIMSEGMIETSKYAAAYERSEEYTDSYASSIYATEISTVALALYPRLGAATVDNGGVQMNTIAELCESTFYVGDNIDENRDIKITCTFLITTLAADGRVNIVYNIVGKKTDCTNTTAGFLTGNTDLSCELQAVFTRHELTLLAAQVNSNTFYSVDIGLNDNVADITLYNISVEWYTKRVL